MKQELTLSRILGSIRYNGYGMVYFYVLWETTTKCSSDDDYYPIDVSLIIVCKKWLTLIGLDHDMPPFVPSVTYPLSPQICTFHMS